MKKRFGRRWSRLMAYGLAQIGFLCPPMLPGVVAGLPGLIPGAVRDGSRG